MGCNYLTEIRPSWEDSGEAETRSHSTVTQGFSMERRRGDNARKDATEQDQERIYDQAAKRSSPRMISKIEEMRSLWSGQHMALLAGSWRPAGWTGLSPASPKEEQSWSKGDGGDRRC
jgi:hypothetical protein